MKIVVRAPGSHLFLLFPTALILSRPLAGLTAKIIGKKCPGTQIGKEDILRLFAAIKRCRHQRWVLVDIHTAKGERVYIRL